MCRGLKSDRTGEGELGCGIAESALSAARAAVTAARRPSARDQTDDGGSADHGAAIVECRFQHAWIVEDGKLRTQGGSTHVIVRMLSGTAGARPTRGRSDGLA